MRVEDINKSTRFKIGEFIEDSCRADEILEAILDLSKGIECAISTLVREYGYWATKKHEGLKALEAENITEEMAISLGYKLNL